MAQEGEKEGKIVEKSTFDLFFLEDFYFVYVCVIYTCIFTGNTHMYIFNTGVGKVGLQLFGK